MKIKEFLPGISISILISLIAWYLGNLFPIIGGPVIGLFIGLLLASLLINQERFIIGMQFTSKKVLQYAVVLLGFGLNLSQVFNVGLTSLPIILTTIATALITAYVIHKLFKLDSEIVTLVGVGSSICGGSAIAATAPVIKAKDESIATAISVIFFFIIPITLGLSIWQSKKDNTKERFSLTKAIPNFILWFLLASLITTVAMSMGVPAAIFAPLKDLSKFMIIMAMTAIGYQTNLKKLITKGGSALLVGGLCWLLISVVSLLMQKLLGFW